MDYYHIWGDLKDSTKDLEFAESLKRYMGRLQEQRLIAGYHLTRRKLGFGPRELGEFHIVIETEDLAQLEQAFQTVKERSGTVEQAHRAVYSAVCHLTFALYRDFPDRDR
jgi:hypothetical protein